MNRNAGTVLTLFKALVEFTVNTAIAALSPTPQRRAVQVLALTDREWERAMARRRGLGRI